MVAPVRTQSIQAFETAVNGGAVDAEASRQRRDVVAAVLQRPAQIVVIAQCIIGGDFGKEVFRQATRINLAAIGKRGCNPQRIEEFAQIARPVMVKQNCPCRLIDPVGLAVFLLDAAEKLIDQPSRSSRSRSAGSVTVAAFRR